MVNSLTFQLEKDYIILFKYRNVYAHTFKKNNVTFIEFQVLTENDHRSRMILLLCLDLLAVLTGEGFMLYDGEQRFYLTIKELPEIENNICIVDNKDVLPSLYNLIYEFEYLKGNQKIMFVHAQRYIRYEILEKKE